jgi:hypothetical protein
LKRTIITAENNTLPTTHPKNPTNQKHPKIKPVKTQTKSFKISSSKS